METESAYRSYLRRSIHHVSKYVKGGDTKIHVGSELPVCCKRSHHDTGVDRGDFVCSECGSIWVEVWSAAEERERQEKMEAERPKFGGRETGPLYIPKVNVKTISEVDYNELNRMVWAAFGLTHKEADIVADYEWHNDSQYTVYIAYYDDPEDSFRENIDTEYGEGTYDELLKLRNGEQVAKVPPFGAMLDYCGLVGWIQPGEYTVTVMW